MAEVSVSTRPPRQTGGDDLSPSGMVILRRPSVYGLQMMLTSSSMKFRTTIRSHKVWPCMDWALQKRSVILSFVRSAPIQDILCAAVRLKGSEDSL